MSFTPSKTCLYRFVSAMDKKMVLDMSQNPHELNKAIVYEWHNASHQKFAIRQVSNGKFALFSAKNNKVLIPENGGHHNGTRILLGAPSKQSFEFWSIEEAKHPKLENRRGYFLKSHCGKALDICEQKCKNNQQVIQWDLHGNLNQIWIIQEVY